MLTVLSAPPAITLLASNASLSTYVIEPFSVRNVISVILLPVPSVIAPSFSTINVRSLPIEFCNCTASSSLTVAVAPPKSTSRFPAAVFSATVPVASTFTVVAVTLALFAVVILPPCALKSAVVPPAVTSAFTASEVVASMVTSPPAKTPLTPSTTAVLNAPVLAIWILLLFVVAARLLTVVSIAFAVPIPLTACRATLVAVMSLPPAASSSVISPADSRLAIPRAAPPTSPIARSPSVSRKKSPLLIVASRLSAPPTALVMSTSPAALVVTTKSGVLVSRSIPPAAVRMRLVVAVTSSAPSVIPEMSPPASTETVEPDTPAKVIASFSSM